MSWRPTRLFAVTGVARGSFSRAGHHPLRRDPDQLEQAAEPAGAEPIRAEATEGLVVVAGAGGVAAMRVRGFRSESDSVRSTIRVPENDVPGTLDKNEMLRLHTALGMRVNAYAATPPPVRRGVLLGLVRLGSPLRRPVPAAGRVPTDAVLLPLNGVLVLLALTTGLAPRPPGALFPVG